MAVMTGRRLYHQESAGVSGGSRPIKNRGRLVGVVCRNVDDQGTAMFVNYPIAHMFTGNLYWDDIEPVRGGGLDLTKIAQWSDFAALHNVPRFRVRLFAGKYAPQWAKTIPTQDYPGGFTPLPWDSSDATGGTVGPFWDIAHREAYYEMTQELAQRIDAEFPQVCEVTDSTVMTTYSEPYLRGFGAMDTAMKQAALDAGYDYAKDEEAIAVEMVRQHDLWAPIGISVVHAYNPWGRLLDATTIKWDNTYTMGNLEAFSDLGRFAVSFNTSLGNPVTLRGSNYQDIWENQNRRWASGIQTMTVNKMEDAFYDPDYNTPYKVCELAVNLGFTDVEVPGGCEDHPDLNYRITPEQADVLLHSAGSGNSGFLGNVMEGQNPSNFPNPPSPYTPLFPSESLLPDANLLPQD